jgi:hypothetical protein
MQWLLSDSKLFHNRFDNSSETDGHRSRKNGCGVVINIKPYANSSSTDMA